MHSVVTISSRRNCVQPDVDLPEHWKYRSALARETVGLLRRLHSEDRLARAVLDRLEREVSETRWGIVQGIDKPGSLCYPFVLVQKGIQALQIDIFVEQLSHTKNWVKILRAVQSFNCRLQTPAAVKPAKQVKHAGVVQVAKPIGQRFIEATVCGGTDIRAFRFREGDTVVFGNEREVPEHLRAICTERVSIPQSFHVHERQCLAIDQAALVFCYEAFTQGV